MLRSLSSRSARWTDFRHSQAMCIKVAILKIRRLSELKFFPRFSNTTQSALLDYDALTDVARARPGLVTPRSWVARPFKTSCNAIFSLPRASSRLSLSSAGIDQSTTFVKTSRVPSRAGFIMPSRYVSLVCLFPGRRRPSTLVLTTRASCEGSSC